MKLFPLKMVLLLAAFGLAKGCQEKKTSAAGNTITINLGSEPASIHPNVSTDAYATRLYAYTIDMLCTRDLDTNEWKPGLAESWEISKDHRSFTFKLRDGLKFHDGKPVTVEDIKFSFDMIFDPALNTAHLRPYFENINSPEILDSRTIRFTAKDDYFNNFTTIAGMWVLPKHFYANQANKKEFNKTIVGSGPYKLVGYDKGKRFVLEQNPDWWGRKDPEFAKHWNFKRVVLRFISEQNVVMESFKKGDLDYIGMNAESYLNKTSGSEWGSKVFKVKTENKAPKGFSYVGWNNNHPILGDKTVRKALGMLYNRDEVMAKFEHNLSAHAAGPIYPASDYQPEDLRPLTYDPKGALQLLTGAGWKDSDSDGILDKVIKGVKTPLSITILEPSEEYSKYITIYKEEARKMGVEINVKIVEWNTLMKLTNERKFDAIHMAWGAGEVEVDLKQLFHSSMIEQGSNFIAYRNAEVDRLMEEARRTFDRPKRIALVKKYTKLIVDDHPYLFLFTPTAVMYGYSKHMVRPKDTFNYSIGTQTWTVQAP